MPTWGGLLAELKAQKGMMPPFDAVRRKYLSTTYKKTGRNIILYATKWTQADNIAPDLISITEEDIQGLMEVIHGLKGPNLDLIVHSPGGSPEATEAFVSYLRTKFDDIRVIIPQSAMSAATMLACASNRIVMGKHSFIGPIDPQMLIFNNGAIMAVPAQAILDQFRLCQSECEDPKKLGSWLPILGQYGPALLVQSDNALKLSQELVSEWLVKYMFAGKPGAVDISKGIAAKLADHTLFKSHARHINREMAKNMGLIIEDLEADQEFQDNILSIFHATTHTFNGTNAVKIIENHEGRAFIKQQYRPPVEQGFPPKQPGFIHRLLRRLAK